MSFHRNAIRALSGDHAGDAGAVPIGLGSDATRSGVSAGKDGVVDDEGGDAGDAHATADRDDGNDGGGGGASGDTQHAAPL